MKKCTFLVFLLTTIFIVGCSSTGQPTNSPYANATYEALVAQGDAEMDCGEWAKAVTFYSRASNLKPKDWDLKLRLADAYERQAMQTEAYAIYDSIIMSANGQDVSNKTLVVAKTRQQKLGQKVGLDKTPANVISAPVKEPLKKVAKKLDDEGDVIADPRVENPAPAKQAKYAEEPVAKDKKLSGDSERIIRVVESWRNAWTSKNLDAYFASYVNSFKGDKPSRAAWLSERKQKILKAKSINIDLKDLKVKQLSDSEANVEFIQVYQAARYKDQGKKILRLVRGAEGWLIDDEVFMN